MNSQPNKELSIIGLSPGNSYFSTENIKLILEKVSEESREMILMIPDLPAIHTYKALGYSDSQAREKAITKGGNPLRNKVDKVKKESKKLDEAGIHVLDWKTEVEESEVYQARLRVIETLYNQNYEFRKRANESTRKVLEGKKLEIQFGIEAIREGVNYLLKEFAYLDAAAEIHGVGKTTFIYHRSWKLLQNYIDGEFDQRPKEHMGFKIINLEDKT